MSTELKRMKLTGSRNVDLSITRYWGGQKNGTCLQIGSVMDDGEHGYVQLNKHDMEHLIEIWQEDIGPLEIRNSTGCNHCKHVDEAADMWPCVECCRCKEDHFTESK